MSWETRKIRDKLLCADCSAANKVKHRVLERIDKGYTGVIPLQYDSGQKVMKGAESGDEFVSSDCFATDVAIDRESERINTSVDSSVHQWEDGYDYTSKAPFGR